MSQDSLHIVLGLGLAALLVGLLVWLLIADGRRRARLTPEQRRAEDERTMKAFSIW